MLTSLRQRLLPETQRRTIEELSTELEFTGDTTGKRSAFWSMLTLSAVIAAAGVFSDSTATVIGAMIIAPLSTPIMGIALAGVKRQTNGSIHYVLGGVALVVGIGALFSVVMPQDAALLDNSQISGRVSPSLIDLVAAMGSGLAGALALARRDVGAVLPGVAIAISLVPPLVVVGLCAGQGALALAFGALTLFVSNVLSLVVAGLFIFTVLGYSSAVAAVDGDKPDRTRRTVAVLFTVVVAILGVSSFGNYLIVQWEKSVEQTAQKWVAGTPGAEVTDVELLSTTFEVRITSPGELPSTSTLRKSLDPDIIDVFSVRVVNTRGEVVEVAHAPE